MMINKLTLLLFVLCGAWANTNGDDGLSSEEDYLIKHLTDHILLPFAASNPLPEIAKPESSSDEDARKEPLSPDYKDPKHAETKPTDGFSVIDIPAGAGSFSLSGSGGFGGSGAFGGLGGLHGFGDIGGDGMPAIFGNNFFDLFTSLRQKKPWWKGENVCVEREEIIHSPEGLSQDNESQSDEEKHLPAFFGNINFQTCQETPKKYVCTSRMGSHGAMKTFITKYKCCHGFERKENEPGCNKLDLKTMPETLTDLGGNDFYQMCKSAHMEALVEADNVTVFVPLDLALRDYSEKMLELNQIEFVPAERRRRRSVGKELLTAKDLVASHVVAGIQDMSDLTNEDVLHSNYKNSTIRMNMYLTPDGEILYTANCIRMTKKNNLVTNGIAHVLDGVMAPVTRSMKDIIYESNKFNNLRKILEKTGLMKELNESSSYTFFAPNDDAFERLSPVYREKLLRGDECAKNILKHHILGHSLCSSAISVNATTRNIQRKLFRLTRDDNNRLRVANKDDTDTMAVVENADIVATDGLIHEINAVLIPASGLDVNEFLARHNLTEFQQLIADADFTQVLDDMKNITLFPPTNEAIREAKQQLDVIRGDKQQLQEFIMYHAIKGEMKSCDFNNDALMKSLSGGEKIRMNLYNTLPFFRTIYNRVTLNCAKLVEVDEQACGAVMHPVSKVLSPPKKTILELIKDNDEYATFRKLLIGTELEKELNKEDAAYTVLAPTNEAFEKLTVEAMKVLEEDKEKADAVLRMHVIPEVICCSGVGYSSFPFTETINTLSRYSLAPSHDFKQRVRFGDAVVTKCDNVATNGLVHTVNRVLVAPKRRDPFSDLTFMMFNL